MADTHQRRQAGIAGTVIAVAVIAIGIWLALGARNSGTPDSRPSSTTSGTGTMPTSTGDGAAAIVAKVTGIPQSTLDAVGAGLTQRGPAPVAGASPLVKDGKPSIVYIGAEWCPICGMERWALVNALSRFGTLSNVHLTTAPAEPSIPAVATLSLHGATYTSDYLAFRAFELEDIAHKPLDTLDAETTALATKLNFESYPFIVYAGQAVAQGVAYNGTPIAGKTHDEIAAALSDPGSDITKIVGGEANVITAQLCVATGGKPAAVCEAPGVKTAAALLGH